MSVSKNGYARRLIRYVDAAFTFETLVLWTFVMLFNLHYVEGTGSERICLFFTLLFGCAGAVCMINNVLEAAYMEN